MLINWKELKELQINWEDLWEMKGTNIYTHSEGTMYDNTPIELTTNELIRLIGDRRLTIEINRINEKDK